jgi:hypothetical protein
MGVLPFCGQRLRPLLWAGSRAVGRTIITITISGVPSSLNSCVTVILYTWFTDVVGPVAQSVKPLATGWTVRGSNPGGGEIFRTCPDRPWGAPSLLYNGYRVFPGVESGRGVTLIPRPLLVPRSKNRVNYTSTLHTGLRGL